MSYLEQFDDLAAQPAAQVSVVSRWLRTDARPFFTELRAQRPVLVGHGHHSCLGRYVAAELIPEVVRRLLLRPGARLPSPDGDLDFRGVPLPERRVIAFDPVSGAARSHVGTDPVAAGASR